MNCKQGDLAIIVAGKNTGALVHVLGESMYGTGFWFIESVGSPLPGDVFGRPVQLKRANIADARLKPIRDQPDPDETLLWAPVPSEVTA